MKLRLREHREKAGLTQQELAEKANCSRQFVNMLENNDDINVSASVLARLAQALGKTVDDLIFFENTV